MRSVPRRSDAVDACARRAPLAPSLNCSVPNGAIFDKDTPIIMRCGALIGSWLIVICLIATAATGCGGSDSTANDASTSKAKEAQEDKVELASPGEGEPSRAFLQKKGKNTIATFGSEASAKEREAASVVLAKSYGAREAGNWAAQCSTLSAPAKKESRERAEAQGVGGGGCAKELQARAEPLQISKQVRVNTLKGPIDALRVEGPRGWALYHGVKGVNYAMRMEKEGGEWKVGDVLEKNVGLTHG